MKKTFLVSATCFIWLLSVSLIVAQTGGLGQVKPAEGLGRTWKGPDLALIKQLLAEDDAKGGSKRTATKPPIASGVKFTPSGDSGVARTLADAFGRTAEEKATLTDGFNQIKDGYNAEVSKQGKSNDLAAAMTFFIVANVTAYHKVEVSDPASEQLYASIASTLSSMPAIKSMSNAEKQQMHDWLVCMGGFVLSVYEQSKAASDKDGLAQAAELAVLSTKIVLGVDIKNLSANSSGVKLTGSAPAIPASVVSANQTGISTSTTTFNDGWTAQIDTDFVRLTKGDITVLLFFPEMFTDATRSLDTADFTWNSVVVPRFSITSATKIEDPIPDVIERLYYVEGSGTEKATGRSGFLAMKTVVIGGGVYKVVLAIAPSREAYKSAFPEPKSLSAMLAANRFALSASDLVGTWSEMDGNSLYFYNSNTGNYAGMSTAAVSSRFAFNSDGSYQSLHAYGSTQMGVTRGGQEKYSGRFTVAPWELSLSNRYQGKTDVFTGYFEAVKNGRILRITNKAASGNNYNLALVR